MSHPRTVEHVKEIIGDKHLATQSNARVGDHTIHRGDIHEVKEILKLVTPVETDFRRPFSEKVITEVAGSKDIGLVGQSSHYYR